MFPVTKTQDLLDRRQRLLGPNQPTFYEEPVHIVRGEGAWLWDADGKRYLDCYNNVPHVGHGNPRVVEAIASQAATLNTHTRYLHEGILDYAEALTATFDDSLDTLALTCTGSEANDMAMRMAMSMTSKRGFIATDATYHGNTWAVAPLSRNNVPEGLDTSHLRWVPAPDSYRPQGGQGGQGGQEHAQAFAASIKAAIAELEASEHGFAGIILCPYFVNEGFPQLPPGWLKPAIEAVRAAGGIFIADEVQPGFGRLGSHMWGHQFQAVQPDIVTLGKPMANGHPVGGVVTRYEIMARFRQSFRYFNTFGGNPVSCAAAHATLNEIFDKDLMAHAKAMGDFALSQLEALKLKYPVIGDVRGKGLLFGAEMVLDHTSKEPASDFCDRVINQMKDRGIILSKLGRHKNTLKIRPPMVISQDQLALMFKTLDQVLASQPLNAA